MAIKYCDFANGLDYYDLDAWTVSTAYVVDELVKNNSKRYKCIQAHTSSADDEPGVGANWETYWTLEADGTASKPFKTITDASRGLTGGDEVRVAKSPDPTDLTGTLDFTLGSTTVTGTGTSFTTELAANDFIKGADGFWYEVVSITSDTQLTLYKAYAGDNASGVSSQKLGITSTGTASSSTEHVQEVMSAGSSSASRLKISGGWDLSTETQTGQTYFRQAGSSRNGYGLYISAKSYLEIEKVSFLRYYYGISTSGTCNYIKYETIFVGGIGTYGIEQSTASTNWEMNNIDAVCVNNNSIRLPGSNHTVSNINIRSSGNFYISTDKSSFSDCVLRRAYLNLSGDKNSFSSLTIEHAGYDGLYISGSHHNYFIDLTVSNSGVGNHGIYLYNSRCNTFVNLTCNNNGGYGIYLYNNSYNNKFYRYSGTGNSSGDIYWAAFGYADWKEHPIYMMQHFKTTDDNRTQYQYGLIKCDTANARSGKCLQITPSDADNYVKQTFLFPVNSGNTPTVSLYIKKNSSFNGSVRAALYFLGKRIDGWDDITPTQTDTYEQKSLVVPTDEIDEQGSLELRIECKGTAGDIFIDDIGFN